MLKIKINLFVVFIILTSNFIYAQDYDPVALNKCQEMWSNGLIVLNSNDFGASECEIIIQDLPV